MTKYSNDRHVSKKHGLSLLNTVPIHNPSLTCIPPPFFSYFLFYIGGFPGSSAGKESACNARDPSSIPGVGKTPGEGVVYPLQYSWASLVAQLVKNPSAVWETWVWPVNKQCYGSSRWTGKGPSHTYTCTHSPPTPLPSRLPHNIEQSSMCYTVVDPCWLSILNLAMCTSDMYFLS